eukprot:TRINITY_DN7642_c0_g1_i4.p1 TRINITY_DN7642_c0_g1~~TRINITY_DN7642_c0_g1_i4.p1  ORF type:complete len:115 (+),score=14.82 TRINITY_DN7642_c0_g1_i4:262-606(+)
MQKDRKLTALKQLQGHIWQAAYESGQVKGHVYEDVVPAFKRLVDAGAKIYIYSSGSIQAQKLLFGYSEAGDLLKVSCQSCSAYSSRPLVSVVRTCQPVAVNERAPNLVFGLSSI